MQAMSLDQITPRQLAFLQGLHDLSRNQGVAVHYTQVAEHLGVNRYSAYDMLRVLERKHLVATDYVLGSSKDGPGRSRVVFYPSDQGLELLRQAGIPGVNPIASQEVDPEDQVSPEEWARFKDAILLRLREARTAGHKRLMTDLLSRLPERRRSLHFCAQMVTALVLNLERVKDRMPTVSPYDALGALSVDGDADVGALTGLSLGSALFADEPADPGLVSQLLGQMQSFQEHLHSLSGDSKRWLSAYVREAIHVLHPPVPQALPAPQDQS